MCLGQLGKDPKHPKRQIKCKKQGWIILDFRPLKAILRNFNIPSLFLMCYIFLNYEFLLISQHSVSHFGISDANTNIFVCFLYLITEQNIKSVL